MAELAQEMGLKRYRRFMNYAERRLAESVRDCKDDNPRSKAETTRAASDGYHKLVSIAKTVHEDQFVAIKIAEHLTQGERAEGLEPRVIIQEASIDDDSAAEQATDESEKKP